MEDQVQSSSCPIMQECLRKVRENAEARVRIQNEYEHNYSQLEFAKVYAWRYRDDYRDIMETLAGMYFEASSSEKQTIAQIMSAVTRSFGRRYLRWYNNEIKYYQRQLKISEQKYADNMADAAVIEVDCYNCR